MESLRSQVFNYLERFPKASLKKCWRVFHAYPPASVKGYYYEWRRYNKNPFLTNMIFDLYRIMRDAMTPTRNLKKKEKEKLKVITEFLKLLKEGAPSI